MEYFKQTEKLTKAVLDLNKRFDKAAKYQVDKDKKDKTLFGILKSTATQRLKEKMSMRGIGEMMGLRQGSFMGDVFGALMDKRDEKKQTNKNAFEFAKNMQKFGKVGAGEAGLKEGIKIFQRQQELLKELKKMEDDITAAEGVGQKSLAEAHYAEAIAKIQAELNEIGGKKKKQSETKTQGVDLSELAEALIAKGGINERALVKMEKKYGPLNPEAKEGLFSGIQQGVMDELLKANEEQVEQLKRLVEISKPSVEDKVEKNAAERNQRQDTEDKKNDKSEKRGLLASLKSLMNLPGLIGNLASNLMKSFGSIASIISTGFTAIKALGGVTSTAARAVAPALANPAVAVAAGGAAATFAATSVVASEAGAPLRKAVQENSMLGAMSGDTAMASAIIDANDGKSADEIRKNQAIEQEMLKDAPWYTRIYGIGKDEYLLKKGFIKKGDPHVQFGSGQGYKQTPTEISKTEETDRERQMLTLAQNQKRLEDVKDAQNNTSQSNTVVNNNSNINNVQKITKVNAPVRNFDPSYNRRLDYAMGIHTVGIRG